MPEIKQYRVLATREYPYDDIVIKEGDQVALVESIVPMAVLNDLVRFDFAKGIEFTPAGPAEGEQQSGEQQSGDPPAPQDPPPAS